MTERDQPKRATRWKRAILIILGVLVVTAATTGVLVWRWSRSDKGKAFLDLFGDTMRASIKASSAPGTAELRKLGCDQAIVFEGADVKAIVEDAMRRLNEGTQPKSGGAEIAEAVYLHCMVIAKENAPSCPDIARTYAGVTKSDGPFMVAVSDRGDRTYCHGSFDAGGNEIGAAPRPEELRAPEKDEGAPPSEDGSEAPQP